MFSHARAYRNICCNMRMPETHAWGWVHVNAGAHAYIHVARETDTVTVTVIDRQTDRQTDRVTGRQRRACAHTQQTHTFTPRTGAVFAKLGAPTLLGMLTSGILLSNVIEGGLVYMLPESWSATIRAFGLCVILMRSGLEMDVRCVARAHRLALHTDTPVYSEARCTTDSAVRVGRPELCRLRSLDCVGWHSESLSCFLSL